ncbi:MAG: hypothetical protein AAGI15_12585, partial [Pseudomonadota bacterium]
MPIINRTPPSETPEEEPPKPILPRQSTAAPQAPTPQALGAMAQPARSSVNLGGLLSGVFGVLALLGIGYAAFTFLPQFLKAQEQVQVVTGMDIERALRAHGLIALLEKKIAQNQRALGIAEQSKDPTMADTMRLALSKNLEDLNGYQDAYIDALAGLHQLYQENESAVSDALKAELQNSSGAMAVGKADAVTEISALLKAVPAEGSATNFFASRLKPQ